MSNAENIRGLMAEMGRILELRAVFEVVGEEHWVLDLDGQHAIVAEYLAGDDRLFLTAEAGIPPAEARPTCYEILLAYNALWRQTGGLRMAVEGQEGAILQIADIAAEGLDASTLRAVLENFIGKLGEWMEIITMGPTDEAGQARRQDAPGALRV